MRKIVSLSLLFIACNTQSQADLQKEYDSIVLEQKSIGGSIAHYTNGLTAAQKFKDDSAAVGFRKLIDSLTARIDTLEKRRRELADNMLK